MGGSGLREGCDEEEFGGTLKGKRPNISIRIMHLLCTRGSLQTKLMRALEILKNEHLFYYVCTAMQFKTLSNGRETRVNNSY